MSEPAVFPHFSGVSSVAIHEQDYVDGATVERETWVDLARMCVTEVRETRIVVEERVLGEDEVDEDAAARAVKLARAWLAEHPDIEVVSEHQVGRLF